MNNLTIITLKKKGITDFAKERNLLLKKAKTEWVMFVDSDEVITPQLRKEIIQLISNPIKSINGYYLTRRDNFFGKELKHGEFSTKGMFGTSRLMRLARKKAGNWARPVHEIWKVRGKTGELKNPLLHYPHPDLRSFIGNINYFSGLHAMALEKEGKKSSIIKIVVWPPGKFVYNYFFRLGFLDGMIGFVAALMMSFHSFLAWSKLWLITRKTGQAK